MDEPRLLTDDAAALHALSRAEILYTDLDGTLLSRGGLLLGDAERRPSTVTAEAIVALNRAGLTVVPVSGRTESQLTELVRLVGWLDLIAEVGAVSTRNVGLPDRETTYNIGSWDAGALPAGRTPLEVIDGHRAFETLADAFPGRIEHHTPWHTGRHATHLLRGCIDQAAGQEVLDASGVPADLLDNGQIHPPRHGLTCADEIHAYHIVPRGVSKAQAIRVDLERRGLSPDQAIAIGDSATDLAMGEAVGVMVLVANALDSPATHAAVAADERARVLSKARGEGWAELAELWLGAQLRR